MSVRKATRFLNRVLEATLTLCVLAVVIALAERFFHPFSPLIDRISAWMNRTEKLLGKDALMGISVGMIALTVAVTLFPLFLRGVDRRQYRTNTVRGVIASVVFFFSQALYGWAEQYGQLHLLGSMLFAIAVTLVIIEFLALSTRIDEEVSLRTDLLSAAASGLASGIVIRLVSILATLPGR